MSNQNFQEEKINDEIADKFSTQVFQFKENGLSLIQPFNQIFGTGRVPTYYQKIREFEVFEDDICLTSHPKSGTRWLMEIVWLIKNNVDIEKAKSISLNERVPFMDFDLVFPFPPTADHLFSDMASKAERPRILKAHLSYEMLPIQVHTKKPKIIQIIRNPRDVCVSFKNHFQCFENYHGDLETITELFLRDKGPYYGPYFANILGYWKHREEPNILVIFYEEMQKDLKSVVRKISKFLDVDFKEENMEKLCDHVSFKKMKANPMVNLDKDVEKVCQIQNNDNPGKVIHKGKSGSWREHYDENTIERFKLWEQKWLKDTDLEFIYEI